MNKLVKITALLGAAVFAAAAAPIAGCTPGSSKSYSQKLLEVSTRDGELYWRQGKEIICDIGYEKSTDTAISFTSSNALTNATGKTVTLPDGHPYSQGDLKPAWAELEKRLGVTLKDMYQPLSSDDSISKLISDVNDERLYTDENGRLVSDEGMCLWDFDIITGSCSAIQSEQTSDANAKYLDLSMYLDYMPNYAAFLESNPIIYLSLTSNTENGAMYYAPYFDGNDDVEKYTLIQKSWAEKLLDSDLPDAVNDETATFKEQAEAKNETSETGISTKSGTEGDNVVINGSAPSVKSFMGQSGGWTVDIIDPQDANMERVVNITVSYDSALAAAKKEGTPLYKAIKDAAGRPYEGESGNIVDLQNFAITEKGGEVTGLQLLNILRAYIDVAYLLDRQPLYTEKNGLKRSDVFCGASAAWDVDLLAAMSRCVVTNYVTLGDSINSTQELRDLFAIGGRSSFTQRIADMYALAGELYGVRGLESRYEFTYIDHTGALKDAREDAAAWNAMDNLSAFVKEGLLYTGDVKGTDRSVYSLDRDSRGPVYFLEHDYVQTQTLYQMRLEDGVDEGAYLIPKDYNFSPILTAVSKWNDGSEKIMRFTESWRSVKNTGFCVPYRSVSDDPERLAAVLAFIDFFFSKDGQILMSYGPISANGNENPNGWWYGRQVMGSEADLSDTRKFRKISDETSYLKAQYESINGTCFVYDGTVYEGISYAGRSIPIMTDDNINCFKGKTYGKENNKIGAYTLNYTNYARKVIGSALPIGNKDQGFEYQCTAECGKNGAQIVDKALNYAGVIKHVYQKIDNPKNNMWYVIVPTLLPLSSSATDFLKKDNQKTIDKLFSNSSSIARNAFVRVMYNGYGNGTIDGTEAIPSDSAGIITKLRSLGLPDRINYISAAWNNLYKYYIDVVSKKI